MVSHDIIGAGISQCVFQCRTGRETSAASAAQVAKAVSRAKWEWSVHVKVAREPLQVQGHILLTRATKTRTMHVKAPTGDPTENGDALLCSFE